MSLFFVQTCPALRFPLLLLAIRAKLDYTISARIVVCTICKLAYRPEIVSQIGYTILKRRACGFLRALPPCVTDYEKKNCR